MLCILQGLLQIKHSHNKLRKPLWIFRPWKIIQWVSVKLDFSLSQISRQGKYTWKVIRCWRHKTPAIAAATYCCALNWKEIAKVGSCLKTFGCLQWVWWEPLVCTCRYQVFLALDAIDIKYWVLEYQCTRQAQDTKELEYWVVGTRVPDTKVLRY